MTIENAINNLENIQKKLPKTDDSQLKSSIEILMNLQKIVGENATIPSELERLINTYATSIAPAPDDSEINSLNLAVLNYYEQCRDVIKTKIRENGKIQITKSNRVRKIAIICSFVSISIIAVIAGIFAICSYVLNLNWANDLVTILGILDFTIGSIGFAVERINDLNSQSTNFLMNEAEHIQSQNISPSEQAKKTFEIYHFINGDKNTIMSAKRIDIDTFIIGGD